MMGRLEKKLTEGSSAADEVLVRLKETPQLSAVCDAILQHRNVPRALP